LRVSLDITLSVFLWIVSAIHIYHGALLFHRVAVGINLQPGRACASSSFLVDPSAIGVVDPQFCPNLQLVLPSLSCSSITGKVEDAEVSAFFDIPSKMFFTAQECSSSTNTSQSPQCKAFFSSYLSPDSEELKFQTSSAFVFFERLSKICRTSIAHLSTHATESVVNLNAITSLLPAISQPSSFSPFCSCNSAWAILLRGGQGADAAAVAKFLLQEPTSVSLAVEILTGAEAAVINCHGDALGSLCAFPTAVRTQQGNGCACLQWIHFEPKFWWMLLLLQLAASTTAWLREGTALCLPLLAYRNVRIVLSMRSSLPCAIAGAIWRPHLIDQSSLGNVMEHGDGIWRGWLQHLQIFTLAQHLPMFVGCYIFAQVVERADDTALHLPSTALAAQASIVGFGVR
jgi:hypothetical protein